MINLEMIIESKKYYLFTYFPLLLLLYDNPFKIPSIILNILVLFSVGISAGASFAYREWGDVDLSILESKNGLNPFSIIISFFFIMLYIFIFLTLGVVLFCSTPSSVVPLSKIYSSTIWFSVLKYIFILFLIEFLGLYLVYYSKNYKKSENKIDDHID